jgi:hypothetical protein
MVKAPITLSAFAESMGPNKRSDTSLSSSQEEQSVSFSSSASAEVRGSDPNVQRPANLQVLQPRNSTAQVSVRMVSSLSKGAIRMASILR